MVDIGGRRLHLNCTGAGSPVVIIAGAGFSFDWARVQPEIARFTKVCTYDPSGTSWSDPGPTPSCASRSEELHQLLAKASINGPFILVGLSVGALVARTYAAEYPKEVRGVVFVDHAFLDPGGAEPKATPPPNAQPGDADQHVLTLEDLSDFSSLPARSQSLHRWATGRHPQNLGLAEARECVARLATLTKDEAAPLGATPLAVISTGNHTDGYSALQGQLLNLSHDSRQFIAGHSFHAVQIDQPEVVTEAVRAVVDAVRGGRPLRR